MRKSAPAWRLRRERGSLLRPAGPATDATRLPPAAAPAGHERDEAALRAGQAGLLEPGINSQQVRPSQVVEDLHGPAAGPRRRPTGP